MGKNVKEVQDIYVNAIFEHLQEMLMDPIVGERGWDGWDQACRSFHSQPCRKQILHSDEVNLSCAFVTFQRRREAALAYRLLSADDNDTWVQTSKDLSYLPA